MTPLFLAVLLFVHWVGDYLLQFNAMANNKSRSLRWLTLHVLVYSGGVLVFGFIYFPPLPALEFMIVNGLLHFLTDLATSRVSARYKDIPRIYYPVIGFDQFIHTVTLIYTAQYFLTVAGAAPIR